MTRFAMICLTTILLTSTTALGQTASKKTATASRSLDATAQKLEADFLKALSELAGSYEEAGDTEKAKLMLQAILKLRPDADAVKEKMKQLEESIFSERHETIDMDVSKGWVATGVAVEKGKKIRVEAVGTYKLIVNDELGPDGYQSKEGRAEEMLASAPAGSLIARVVRKPGEASSPFAVGGKKEFSPPESGVLAVRINAPADAKCVGRIRIRVSGNITEASR